LLNPHGLFWVEEPNLLFIGGKHTKSP
jgi:hypothetical protein